MFRTFSTPVITLFFCLCTLVISAQSVGINTLTPDTSAVLDIESTNKGILVPRMDSGQRTSIFSPAIGLLVFDIDTETFWYYQSDGWLELIRGAFKNDMGTVRSTGNDGADDFVFGAESLPPSSTTSDTLFLFDKSKGAFRAGRVLDSKNWAPDSIGFCSFAAGSNVLAKGLYSFASGRNSEASGNYSMAHGYNVKAQGVVSTAFGLATNASGPYSFASGASTNAAGYYSNALGFGTTASGSVSLATGIETVASGSYAAAFGLETDAESFASVALGRYNNGGGSMTSWQSTDPIFEIGIGNSEMDRINALTVLKDGTITFRKYEFPNYDGGANQYLSTNGVGILQWTDDIGAFVRSGQLVKSNEHHYTDDFVFGAASLPSPASTADTMFLFDKSKGAFRSGRVFNSNDWAPDSIGQYSFATGSNVMAKGTYSFASGRDSKATGNYAVAMGYNVIAGGTASTAFGLESNASGSYSYASGYSTTASGFFSNAIGTNSTASGIGSFASGSGTLASASFASALGVFTVAESYGSVVLGRYNNAGGSLTSWQSTDPLFEIGIGTSAANTSNALTVLKNGTISFKAYTFPLNDGSANQHLSTDGSGQLQWQDDIGVFVRTGQLVKSTGNHYTDDFVFGSASLPPAGETADTLMFFDKSKGAFRAGVLEDKNYWAPDSIGLYSFAVGSNAKASGIASIAIGNRSDATQLNCIAIGHYSTATANGGVAIGGGAFTYAAGDFSMALRGGRAEGSYSLAIGSQSISTAFGSVCIGSSSDVTGNYAVSLGNDLNVESFHATAIGTQNIGGGSPDTWVESDPLFEIGNGQSEPSNALTILKNGDTRIQHGNNGGSSGLKLENSSNGDWIRMYVSSGSSDLRLYSKSQGGTIIGAFNDFTGEYTYLSDRRVKKDFQELHFNWDAMMRLQPMTYQFIGDKENTVSIGMIAQDVKEVYPEMVRYQEDDDLYHMNYSGFGVIAIKAIQELKKELVQKEELLETVVQKNIELESRIERLEALMKQ